MYHGASATEDPCSRSSSRPAHRGNRQGKHSDDGRMGVDVAVRLSWTLGRGVECRVHGAVERLAVRN
jgi:hypothetical protein